MEEFEQEDLTINLGDYISTHSFTSVGSQDLNHVSFESETSPSDAGHIDSFDVELFLYEPITQITHNPVVLPGRENTPWYAWAIDTLTRIIESEPLEHKRRCLKTLREVLFNPRYTSMAISLKEFNVMCANQIKNNNTTVRIEIAKAFVAMTYNSVGRYFISELALFEPQIALLEDTIETIRISAAQSLFNLSMSKFGCEAIHKADAVEAIFEALFHIQHCSQLYILDCLHNVMVEDFYVAIEKNFIKRLKPFLEVEDEILKGKASRLLLDMIISERGKQMVLEEDIIPIVVENVSSPLLFTRIMSCGILMMTSVITKGRKLCFELGVIQLALGLLSEESTEIRFNALRLLGLMTEYPPGREELRAYTKIIKPMSEDSKASIRKAARSTMRSIEWAPG